MCFISGVLVTVTLSALIDVIMLISLVNTRTFRWECDHGIQTGEISRLCSALNELVCIHIVSLLSCAAYKRYAEQIMQLSASTQRISLTQVVNCMELARMHILLPLQRYWKKSRSRTPPQCVRSRTSFYLRHCAQ